MNIEGKLILQKVDKLYGPMRPTVVWASTVFNPASTSISLALLISATDGLPTPTRRKVGK